MIAFITFVLVVMLFRPAQQLGDLYRPVSSGNYLYGTDYVTLEKAGIVAKLPLQIRVNPVPGARRKSIQE